LGGEPLRQQSSSAADESEPEEGELAPTPGRESEFGHLAQVVGLVWRSVVLWMVLLALLTLARLIG
jgi:adenosylcobinamide-phosphate synthase